MLKFLIYRPVAVLMTTAALLIFSVLALRNLPVSLLPDTEVPEIVIKVQYPNASPEAIERNMLKPIRESMQTLQGLKAMESRAGSENGQIRLLFDYGLSMNLLYVEINEKIDRLSSSFPSNMDRPLVIRLNASDIPIIKLQMSSKEQEQLVDISELAEAVIKKRMEQIEGVSLVDLNGLKRKNISVRVDEQQLTALGIDETAVIQAIQTSNRELGAISVKDGQYRYYLRMANKLSSVKDILNLPVHIGNNNYIPLNRLAQVEEGIEKTNGTHIFQNKEAIVLNIHKQAEAQMNQVVPAIYESLEQLKQDYPNLAFELTQDQSIILNTGIDNLTSSLLLGGAFAFLVLFLFMGNYRIPIIMGLSLPLSLLISFLLFNWLNISINIISLSGLALGLGMLIDNSIIVLDNINRKRNEGLALIEACIVGTNEIISALISSVLTTLAVFVPLVFLSGVAGALFYDQAVSVAIILCVSLLVAFILLPLLYRLFFNKKSDLQEDSTFFKWIIRIYKQLHHLIFQRPKISFAILFCFIPISLYLGSLLIISGLPEIEKQDISVHIDWNEPVDIAVSKQRVFQMVEDTQLDYQHFEADLGLNQFILQAEESDLQQANLYFLFNQTEKRKQAENRIANYFSTQFPDAKVTIIPAENAFDYIFKSDQEAMSVRWRPAKSQVQLRPEEALAQLEQLPIADKRAGESLETISSLSLRVNHEQLRRLGIAYDQFIEKINRLFGNYRITEINAADKAVAVQLFGNQSELDHQLKQSYISGRIGDKVQQYALSELVRIDYTTDFKYITSDASGPYFEAHIPAVEPESISGELSTWAGQINAIYELVGQYFADRENVQQLIYILLIAIAMLYFILSAQFENFIQPLIVITTLPLGLGGAFIFLLLSGQTLNIMSGIGLVVMLGIIVNDSILKIDIINRRLKSGLTAGESKNVALDRAIQQGGLIRLKPIIMTSVTTILALLPLLFAEGLGAELQKPLVISVLGGLTIGTLSSLYYVPLTYWFIYKLTAKTK